MYGIEAEGGTERYRLSRRDLERQGRRRSFWRTSFVAACLLLVQLPFLAVATGRWDPANDSPALGGEVPVRLALLLDVGLVVAYVVLAHRALEMIRSVRPRATGARRVGAWAFWVVVAGASLDVVENLVVWDRAGTWDDHSTLSVGGLTAAKLGLLLLGLVLFLVAGAKARLHPEAEDAAPTPGARAEGAPPELVICCSGGGIRAASFSLGGLQVLAEKEVYQRADAVVGVSGGGYVAAAYHVLRWRSEPKAGSVSAAETWPGDLDPLPYAPESPEHARLRQNTRYLFDSAPVALHATLSLLFGIAVNVILLAAILGATAWLLAWFLLASGGLTGWGTADADGAAYRENDAWAAVPWVAFAPLALGALLFLYEKVVDRFRTIGKSTRSVLREVSVRCFGAGAALVVLVLVVPVALAWLNDYAASSQSSLAHLIHSVGLGPAADCGDARAACASTSKSAGSARAVTTGSAAAILAALLAVARDVRSQLFGDTSSKTGASSLVKRLGGRVKKVVLPWVAAAVVVLVLVLLLLRWVAAMAYDPELLASWHLAYWYGGLLVAVVLLTDANRTSLHHFYRERLSFAYLVRRSKDGAPEPVDYSLPLRFSTSGPRTTADGPGLVAGAVANVTDPFLVPTDRECTPFVFGHRRIGLTDRSLPEGAMSPSALYERAADDRCRDATIPGAMAMSGAAFSPLAGRENRRVGPYRLVLALANARLGVWLPNPLWIDEADVVQRLVRMREPDAASVWASLEESDRAFVCDRLSDDDKTWLDEALESGEALPRDSAHPEETEGGTAWSVRRRAARRSWYRVRARLVSVLTKPGAFLVLREAFGRTSVLDRSLYVTDGGHYDNLGLVEALRRRPQNVIVLDASNDQEDEFNTLGRAIATARIDLGCEIDFDPRGMRRLDAKRATAAWGRGVVHYPPGAGRTRTSANLWVAKVIMLDDLPWDVETYAAGNPQFPRTSTGDQLYGEFDLEAYRILGREITERMLAQYPVPPATAVPQVPDPAGAGSPDPQPPNADIQASASG
ncbi:patatin-like phospholipase family protein [Nocardioides sp. T2.26MG-1]|uniref:patatin-like phospholipase family protein n=1 Tax=Nocardioides sp. T2.26MG-1 TaxID=3041166 RepID=UPI002477705B|nr:patatin-like phospholipase family protein [Nocardioides sp. T2.26MG-1]CAI9400634.1 hypothetical protein HIDPHFAB_00443 [Nocardioides sp. T2.26MG-1]